VNIDIRKLIVATLFVLNKKGIKFISLDEVNAYTGILEKKFNKKIEFDYSNDFDTNQYEELVDCYTEKSNSYFVFNNEIDINSTILDKSLIIDEDININVSKETNDIYKQYCIGKLIDNCPSKSFTFNSVFKLFMFKYNQLYGNKIDIDLFFNIINEINEIINYKDIEISNISKLELIRIMHKYPTEQEFIVSNNDICLEYINKQKYYEELSTLFTKEQIIFMNKLIDIIITNNNFKEDLNIIKQK